MLKLEGDNFCEHCGEMVTWFDIDHITIRDNKIYHNECLEDNSEEETP